MPKAQKLEYELEPTASTLYWTPFSFCVSAPPVRNLSALLGASPLPKVEAMTRMWVKDFSLAWPSPL